MPLSPADEDRIYAGIDRFIDLVNDVAKIKPGDGEDTPELADRLILWWAKKPAKDRPSADELTFVIGCAVGHFLYHVLEVWWEREPGNGPPEYTLFGKKRIKGVTQSIRINPVEDIRARWPENPESPDDYANLVTDYLDELHEQDQVRHFIAEGE
jgi:hypothetical protein